MISSSKLYLFLSSKYTFLITILQIYGTYIFFLFRLLLNLLIYHINVNRL